jgi:hypothetical protein
MTLARLQILDDVSNLIQTRMPDRLRLTTTGRFPSIPSFRAPGTQSTAVGWRLTSVMHAYEYLAPPTLRGFFLGRLSCAHGNRPLLNLGVIQFNFYL